MCGLKYGYLRLYGNGETDLITKSWCTFNISVPWKWGKGSDDIILTCTPNDQCMDNYYKSRLYGNGETDLITKTWHKFNKVSGQWKARQSQVTQAWLTLKLLLEIKISLIGSL
jgi:hypothetical protein